MFANLISFEGRIRRAEFAITLILCYFVRSSLLAIFGELNLLSTISSVFLVLIFFSQSVKRLHDMDQTGWLAILPVYNPILLLFVDGTRGKNQYGEDPKRRAPLSETFTTAYQPTPSNFPLPDIPSTEPQPFSTQSSATSTAESYIPLTDYVLNADGMVLQQWLNKQITFLNMAVDEQLSQVKTVGRDAFDSCEQLGEVILPLDLLTINKYAFDNCVLLHSIIFPSKLTFVGEYIFGKNCPKVLIFKGKTPPVLEGDFGYNDDRIEVIYVPIGCSEAYREAPSWQKYKRKIF
ncbi:DUF805 domain-containing protein [Capnocytophaga leadbetteri]|uniref:DUF805 domain-containing protein n=1 Tax=Capnocytophaga leadbetteri TaxID=327575 RepID=UPI0028F14F50|nr:DUF805 domain-containing protein [Capnocytophaga leadbetteri]